jgi:hypothetical protein
MQLLRLYIGIKPTIKTKMYFFKSLKENIMTTLNISLLEPMQNWLESQISSGHYANYSDYILDLIRHDQ